MVAIIHTAKTRFIDLIISFSAANFKYLLIRLNVEQGYCPFIAFMHFRVHSFVDAFMNLYCTPVIHQVFSEGSFTPQARP